MIKGMMASRLLYGEMKVREHIRSRIKHMMEDLDMALYDRSSGIGYIYSNFGELLRKVQSVGATAKPNLFQHAVERKDVVVRKDSLNQLRDNVDRLQEMHGRLQFLLTELEGLVKKG